MRNGEIPETELMSEALADAIIPSLGYFGATTETCLKVEINDTVDEIRVQIEAPYPEILNIGSIKFFSEEGDELSRSEITKSIAMSSIYGKNTPEDVYQQLCEGRLLHSNREAMPYFVITLCDAVYISRLEIHNRNDAYGYRSQWIAVTAFRNSRKIRSYSNMSDEKRISTLKKALSILDYQNVQSFEINELKLAFRNELASRIEADDVPFNFMEIIQFLPIHKVNPEVEIFDFKICSHLVLEKWKGKSEVETKFLRPFYSILSTDTHINLLKETLENLILIRKKEKVNVVIGRHEINESRLIANKEKYLCAINKVISTLAENSVTAMLGYGTLLGAVRDNSFLPHDDDVDLIMFDGSTSQAEAAKGKERIVDILNSAGLKAVTTNFWHIHVFCNEVVVDLFPTWIEGSVIFLPMEELRIRSVSADYLLPTSTIKLYNKDFASPRKPEKFLQERYGANWTHPDPYYEWPWKVERLTKSTD